MRKALYDRLEKSGGMSVPFGFKRGTGGTSGVMSLRRMQEVELYPELWNLRGEL